MSRERQFSPLFILVAIIAVFVSLYWAKQILLPIALSVLLSFLLTPLANRIEAIGLPRVLSVILVVLIAFAVFGALGWIVTDQLVALRNELPNHRTKIAEKAKTLRQFTQVLNRFGDEITNGADDEQRKDDEKTQPAKIDERVPSVPPSVAPEQKPANDTKAIVAQEAAADMASLAKTGSPFSLQPGESIPVRVTEMPPSPLTQAQAVLGTLAAPLTALGMVIVLVFFMLLDRENQRNRIIQLFGAANMQITTEALHDATHRVGRYLRMQFLINAGYGIAVAIGLYFLSVPSAIMWGVLGFSLRFLPYLGPWLAAVLPILVSLAVSDGWTAPILVACMYVVYELILNNVAEPMLYGNSIGVSTVGVIIAAIFWTWLWGPIGLILAMPMTVCLVVTARYVPQLRFITVLLADEPPLSPAERIYQRLLAFDYNEPLKLARHHLKTSPLVEFYDDIAIPALILAERDRHAGLLNDEQQAFVHEAAEGLVEDIGDMDLSADTKFKPTDAVPLEPGRSTSTRAPAKILCIPLRDAADETTSRMLGQLLHSEGFQVACTPAGALTSETVDRVAETDSDVVVISVLPPIRPRDSRLLWKRLRQTYPHLPIVVGYWTGPNATESLLSPPGDETSRVATTLAEAVKLVRSIAAKAKLANAASA